MDDKQVTPSGAGKKPFSLVGKLFFPGAEFAEQKYQDHRRFNAIILAILAVYLTMLWGWDYVIDPVGARTTIYLRLAFLLMLPSAIGMWIGSSNRRFHEFATSLILLLVEILWVVIVHQLENGMSRGLGGFMYVLLILVLVTQGMPLLFGLACTLTGVALPQLMAVAGLAPQLPIFEYGLLIWPATGLVILAQVAIAFHYLRRHELMQQLKLLSDTDALTGVRNRRYFMPLLEREAERAQRLDQRLSLLMLDIDHFKEINDAYGHPTGDLVIRRLTDLCSENVRDIDVVARIGGEEFSVLLPGATIEEATEVAERIRARVAGATVQGQADLPVGFAVSIGVATLTPGDHAGFDLFGRADAALYSAKAAGRNRVVTR